jgi:hypothetical protein
MKNKKWILNCALILLASCATSPPELARVEEPLYGTWVNEEYGAAHRFVYIPDGTMLIYNRGAKEPYRESRFSIKEKWTDEIGNIY